MKTKMKTRSSAKKRFKKTSTNRVKRSQAYHRHLLTKKSPKRKRDLRKSVYVAAVDLSRILKLLPY